MMLRRPLAAALLLGLTAGCDSLVTKPTPYTVVQVLATRRDSSPVPGVPLVLYTGQRPMGYATTDSAGRATFERVPEGPAYGVRAEAPAGWAFLETLVGGAATNVRQGLTLVRDSAVTLRFTLLKVGPGSIAARVADETGAPVRGVPVDVYTATTIVRKLATGNDGTVRADDLPFGLYGVAVTRPLGYRDVGEPPTFYVDGLVVEEARVTPVAAVLARCGGTLTARVADPAHGAASGIRVYLYDAAGTLDSARTGADGRATFSTGCGEFGLLIVGTADWIVTPGRGSQYLDGIVVRRGTQREETLRVAFNACRWSLAATVTDAAGTPVGGGSVESYDAFGTVDRRTAPQGSVTFDNLPCGVERGARVISPEGWTVAPGRGSSFFDGLSGTNGQVIPVRFVLRRP